MGERGRERGVGREGREGMCSLCINLWSGNLHILSPYCIVQNSKTTPQ